MRFVPNPGNRFRRPSQAAACRGDERLENPAGCSSTGTTTIHRLTSLKVAPDCNVGFDLDSCDGVTCRLGPLASEGLDGVDNVAATIELHGGVNQLFADAICGRTNRNGLGCDTEIASLDLELAIEENPSERCANVVVFASGSEVNRVTLNLGEPVPGGTRCLSGTLGPIPLNLGEIEISLASTLILMTVSDAGFSDGLLGGTIHANETLALAEAAMPELGPDIHEYLDICDDLSFAPATPCNALSGSYEIGGVARHGGPQLEALAPRLEGTAGALQ